MNDQKFRLTLNQLQFFIRANVFHAIQADLLWTKNIKVDCIITDPEEDKDCYDIRVYIEDNPKPKAVFRIDQVFESEETAMKVVIGMALKTLEVISSLKPTPIIKAVK